MLEQRQGTTTATKTGGYAMLKSNRIILLASTLWAMTMTPALCDSWTFRPGLWETTFTTDSSGLSPEQRARIEAFSKKIPPRKPLQFCQKADAKIPRSIFDPANQPPGTCTEIILSESQTDREVEDVCMLTTSGGGPSNPGQAHRHIILTGDGAGTIDRADFTGGRPGNSLTRKFRWLGANCGNIQPTSN